MNVFDFFFEHSAHLEKEAVLGNKENISYPHLYSHSLLLAEFIKSRWGEENNIILISANSVFFITAYLAILKSGNVCVPLNPETESRNLDFIITKCRANICFITSAIQKKLGLTLDFTITEQDIPSPAAIRHPVAFIKDMQFNADRLAEIIFTSGSTGVPKGVMISHKNIVANTNSIIEYLKLTVEDIVEIVLPFYYCYGLSLLHTHLRVGGGMVLNNTFIFIGSFMNDLQKYRCTGFAGVPSHFQILMRKAKTFITTGFPDLRYVTQAGGKLHDIFIREFTGSFPGVNFYVMYGQTEATARLSYLPPEKLPDKIGSIGKSIPGVVLEIMDKDGNLVTQPDEVGEIVAKGDNIMPGYYGDAETTRETIRDGWLHTGDLAFKDEEGYMYLTARKKEILKIRGKRISPKEIEEVIVTIPDVIDCSIEGAYDELTGETIKVTIVVSNLKENKLTKDSVQKYCSARLASYKVPQAITFIDKFRIAATGKKVKNKPG